MDFKKTFLNLTQWTIPFGYEEKLEIRCVYTCGDIPQSNIDSVYELFGDVSLHHIGPFSVMIKLGKYIEMEEGAGLFKI